MKLGRPRKKYRPIEFESPRPVRAEDEPEFDDTPFETYFQRGETLALLRRFYYASTSLSRVGTSLGDSNFGRGRASSRPVRSFEDSMIFVIDMERRIAELSDADQEVLRRIVKQECTREEAAARMGCSSRSVSMRFPCALDRLTHKLVRVGMLAQPERRVA